MNPHDPDLTDDTRYGFIWKGVHFERCDEDERGLHVYVSSKSDSKMVVISQDGEITLQDMT